MLARLTVLELMLCLQYITWINDGVVAWTIQAAGMGPDPIAQISARPVPQEPLVSDLRTIPSAS